MTGDTATIVGRRVVLRPVTDSDIPFLEELTSSVPVFTESFSAVPSTGLARLPAFESGQAEHRIVELCRDPVPVGYVFARTRPPAAARIAQVGTFLLDEYHATSAGIEAGGLFIAHLFSKHDIRRVEGVLTDHALTRISTGLGRLFEHDATLRESAFVMGAFHDVHILSLSRQDWTRKCERFEAWFGGGKQARP